VRHEEVPPEGVAVPEDTPMTRPYHLLGLASLAVVAFALLGWWRWAREPPEPDEPPDEGSVPSADLEADLRLMWQTRPLPGDPDRRASTPRAVNAASRVFNAVDLVGLTKEAVAARLGDPRTSGDSIHTFPFWSVEGGVVVYRFDTGSYGWQFNLRFDDDGKVRDVERLWIH
jgi:hypothetical protein